MFFVILIRFPHSCDGFLYRFVGHLRCGRLSSFGLARGNDVKCTGTGLEHSRGNTVHSVVYAPCPTLMHSTRAPAEAERSNSCVPRVTLWKTEQSNLVLVVLAHHGMGSSDVRSFATAQSPDVFPAMRTVSVTRWPDTSPAFVAAVPSNLEPDPMPAVPHSSDSGGRLRADQTSVREATRTVLPTRRPYATVPIAMLVFAVFVAYQLRIFAVAAWARVYCSPRP